MGVAAAVVVIAVATVVAVIHFGTAATEDSTASVQRMSTAMSTPQSSRSEVPFDDLAAEFATFRTGSMPR